MKKIIIVLLLTTCSAWPQRDLLALGEKYSDDQLYLSISYNQLFNQPSEVSSSGFSYGLSAGIIKDISLNRQGNWALGFGLGYAFDSFNHGMQVTNVNGQDFYSVDNVLESNTMKLHAVEFPFEVRWRNSNAQRYKFWRIYPGVKFSYNFRNSFRSVSNSTVVSATNINGFKNFQYGLSLSVGYDAFNLHVYYGLSSLFENATLNLQTISTRMLRVGLIVYFL